MVKKKRKPQTEATPLKIIQKQRRRLRNIDDIKTFVFRLLIMMGILWGLFGLVFGITPMTNNDMFPRISAGDLLIYYRLDNTYAAQEVIVFTKNNKTYVGRIVAKGGDKVEFNQDGSLKVNGSIVIENEIYYKTGIYDTDVKYPVSLKSDQFFVLCDYREGARDSRYFGPVNKKEIKGKIIAVLRRNKI